TKESSAPICSGPVACRGSGATVPRCPVRNKEVYFAERVTSLGKDWHWPCLKRERCGKMLPRGGDQVEHEGRPCYAAMLRPKGFGHGGAEGHTFK
ncbi:cysteine-rich protein 1-like, partial [Bos javanicus]|uniref:cysteine-rich protein 1-like n=1 Tax=Bos javanicus TaxID=9906 RepID=UPI002AA8C84B